MKIKKIIKLSTEKQYKIIKIGQMNVCSVKFVNIYPQFVDKIIKTVENFKKGIDTIYKVIIKKNYYIGGIVEKNNTLYYNDVSKK